MASVTKDFQNFPLPSLSMIDCGALLFKTMERQPSNREEESVGHAISRWVGGLPLAIATIGGFIKGSASSVSDVFESLQRSSTVWASTGKGTLKNYNKTLATVFNLALSELNDETRHLVQILAFLNPNHVPEELLHQNHTLASIKFLNDEDNFLRMTYGLSTRQLISRDLSSSGPFFGLHRSLQLNILHSLKTDTDPNKRERVFGEVLSMIQQRLPKASRLQTNEPDIWPQYMTYVPQIISLRRNSLWPHPPLSSNFLFARLLADVGCFLWHTGQIAECEANMKAAARYVCAQIETSQGTAELEELLSDIYLVTGILADCIGVSKRDESLDHGLYLLDLRERAHKAILPAEITIEDEIRLGNARTDLDCALMQRARYARAGNIFEETLLQYKKWGSEEDYHYEYSKHYQ